MLKTVNGIYRTEVMSFPRSGHSLLRTLLSSYFAERLSMCEMYSQPERVLDLDPTTNFQKNHDFNLSTPVKSDRKYLVQIRYPLESIVSWAELRENRLSRMKSPFNPIQFLTVLYQWLLHNGESPGSRLKRSYLEDDWTNNALRDTLYWIEFFQRWVLGDVPNRLILEYESMVARPVQTLGVVLQFLGETDIDEDRIKHIVSEIVLENRRKIVSYKYYKEEFITELRGRIAHLPGILDNATKLELSAICPDSVGWKLSKK